MSQKLTRAYPRFVRLLAATNCDTPFEKKQPTSVQDLQICCDANFGDERGHLEAKSRERLISGGHGF